MKSIAGTLGAPSDAMRATYRGVCMPAYLVTRGGQIWSVVTARFMKPWAVADGYLVVGMRHDGRSVRAPIHQLVAEAFIGPRPCGFDVCHNDGRPISNHADNLRYASRSENLADRELHGTAQRGERNPAAKLTNAQANEIRRRRASGERLRTLASEFGVREATISRIATGTRRAI